MTTIRKPVVKRSYSSASTTTPETTPQTSKGTKLKREVASWSRWLHIYLSMISFAILFFFAVTGLTLNHPDFMSDQQVTNFLQGEMNTEWLAGEGEESVSRLEIVEFLRTQHGIEGAVTDFQADDYECTVFFKGPGYSADAFIDRESGAYDLTETRLGFVAVINDLHKGRDSGSAWSVIIDISAVLMCVVSLTGFTLIFFIKRKRFNGLILATAGFGLCYLIYVIFVP